MIQLASSNLSPKTSQKLQELQTEIDKERTFEAKRNKAQEFWKNRTNSKAFTEIKEKLTDLCVAVGICNYCEQNEAGDIEHIAPKSFFPNLTFVWENYLLACKTCNSGYKLDKCYVLDDKNKVISVERGKEPSHTTVALINPRIENPNKFLILNLETYEFEFMPDLSEKDYNKADKTREILQLNNRDPLKAARKAAAKYYYDRLERIVRILKANSIEEIEDILTPNDDRVDKTLSLAAQKQHLKKYFKRDIQRHQHPSVWQAIKLTSPVIPKWKRLFEGLEDALKW